MKDLPSKPTLADYQYLVRYLNRQRGFKETVPEVFMLFLEEAGEFAKAARKSSGVKLDKNSKEHELGEEAADIFYLLIDLCNHLDIDLEKAFRQKEAKNQKKELVMKKHSAGLIVFRRTGNELEVLLAHMGTPWWAKKDIGAWSIPKGLIEEGEDPLEAAKREFGEELGLSVPDGEFIQLGSVEQHNNKL